MEGSRGAHPTPTLDQLLTCVLPSHRLPGPWALLSDVIETDPGVCCPGTVFLTNKKKNLSALCNCVSKFLEKHVGF